MRLTDHPDYSRINNRVLSFLDTAVSIDKHLFRMVKPRYCSDSDIISGQGGKRSNGRWNVRGVFRCTYASQTPETALDESLSRVRRQHLPDEKALPKTLVCIAFRASRVLDFTDGSIRQRLSVSQHRMIEEKRWLSDNYHNRESLTQTIGRAAFSIGFEALIAPSAADQPHGINVVIFPDNLLAGSSLNVITPVKL